MSEASVRSRTGSGPRIMVVGALLSAFGIYRAATSSDSFAAWLVLGGWLVLAASLHKFGRSGVEP